MQLTAITTAQHFIQAFSWMLIHSLWQGLLLSVVTGMLLSLNKKASSAVRYNLVLIQLLLFVVACTGTFLWEWYKPVQPAIINAVAPPSEDTALSLWSFVNSCITYFTANSPVIVLIWFILFLVRTVRIMGSALYINRARHRFIYQPSDAWKEKVNTLCGKLQLKRAVQLLESGYVNVPMVIGHLKPVILIPVGLLAGLPAGQVEAVLLHELAHIRRNDYVVNCLQTIVEAVFFFNPGLLWISSVLRDERENCCDDIALAQTKNKKEFVQALVSFKEYALERKNHAVAFPGEKKNSLLNRASRILHNQNKPLGTGEKVFFLAGILVLSIVVATASIAQIHGVQKAKKTSHTVSYPHANSTPPVDEHFRASTQHQSSINQKEEAPELQQQHTGNYTYTPPKGSADANPPEAPAQEPPLPMEPTSSDQPIQQRGDVKRQAISAIEKKPFVQEHEQYLKDRQQQAHDAEQAKKDQEQAILDQKQATRDQEHAKQDEQQTRLDEAQAKKSQEQANSDRENAQKAQQLEQLQKKEEVMKNNQNPPL
jgi:beta-lactamase regulating signal transducer with metallopeptidase domain